MAGRKTLAITDRQYQVLQLLWAHGPMTVRQLRDKLPRDDRRPYTTVLGMLQNMEKLGLLSHQQEGITYRYEPAVSKSEATGRLLKDFLGRFFGGSAEALVLGLVSTEALTLEELREIQSMLAEAREDASASPFAVKTRGESKK